MVTVLAWLVEMFGFLLVFLGTHILGHQNQSINLLLQTLTNIFYFVLIPFLLLINDTDLKGRFAESYWYDEFLSKINCQYIEQDKDEKEDIADANTEMEAGVETNQDVEDKISAHNLATKESDDTRIEICTKGSRVQIYDTDRQKIYEGVHHSHSTNSISNRCELIDLEAVNRNSE